MLDWLVEKTLAIVNYVPALFVEQDSPSFELVRGMFGLLLVLLVVCLFALWPRRPHLERTRDKG
jgi:hypothetical protein